MLGGGNPVSGANPAGTGTSLNYIGKHAYANSGGINVNNNVTTMLEFTTQNSYVVADLTVGNSSGSGDDIEFEMSVNGERILSFGVASSNAFPPNSPTILLPPFSKILITGQNLSGSTDRECFATIVGEVYA